MKAKTENKISTIIISIITVFVVLFVVYNFVPIKWLKYLTLSSGQNFGAAVTELVSTNQLSDFPTSYNATINALNNDKLQATTTTFSTLATTTNLTAVGTLNTGTWNADTIEVAYGGTGSTTLAFGQILLGSSTNAVGVVDGFGTSGQFLTSQGADLPPQWTTSAVDQALAYLWTGVHNFTTTALFTNFNASSTLVLGGTSWTFPVADNASGTPLRTDGSGSLTFSSLANASSTVFTSSGTWVRPAGVNSVIVTVVGGGGGGGFAVNSGTPSAGGGGGAGGYAHGAVAVSGDVTVTVGAGGTGGIGSSATASTNGANSSFAGTNTITANGGSRGVDSNNSGMAAGGAGGGTTVANGVIGITGQEGTAGKPWAADSIGGAGGSNPMGQGGHYGAGGTTSAGSAGDGCGGGGSAAGADGSGNASGGAGADGCVIVSWFLD